MPDRRMENVAHDEYSPRPSPVKLAAVILTKNAAKHIGDCIETLGFADRVVVSDSYSDDGTAELARQAGATVLQRPFDNFAGQRNAAMEAVDAEWIFFVDADERIPPELAAEVRQVIAERPEVGWWVPRHNYIAGQRVRHGGFYPDYQLRLLRRDRARYDPARPVHEVVLLDGPSGHLQHADDPLQLRRLGAIPRQAAALRPASRGRSCASEESSPGRTSSCGSRCASSGAAT